jgi:hypothetical protein
MSTPDYTTIGFEKMDRDLRFLMQCFAEVLGELGHAELAANLPWISSTSVEAPAREGRLARAADRIRGRDGRALTRSPRAGH